MGTVCYSATQLYCQQLIRLLLNIAIKIRLYHILKRIITLPIKGISPAIIGRTPIDEFHVRGIVVELLF